MRPSTCDKAPVARGFGGKYDDELMPESSHTISAEIKWPEAGSAKRRILDAMLSGERLTSAQAWKRFGTSRLAALIHQLRHDGWSIRAQCIAVETTDGRIAHVARYWIERGAK